MPLIDPRNFDEADMQSAKIGGAATKRTQDKSMQKVIVQNIETGEQFEALRQNVHDLAANGFRLVGPAPTKADKIVAASDATSSTKAATDDEDGETQDVEDDDNIDDDSTDEEKKAELNELDILRQEADALGVKYHPNSGKKKLTEAIALARAQASKDQ